MEEPLYGMHGLTRRRLANRPDQIRSNSLVLFAAMILGEELSN
jgi:hypothetical protein